MLGRVALRHGTPRGHLAWVLLPREALLGVLLRGVPGIDSGVPLRGHPRNPWVALRGLGLLGVARIPLGRHPLHAPRVPLLRGHVPRCVACRCLSGRSTALARRCLRLLRGGRGRHRDVIKSAEARHVDCRRQLFRCGACSSGSSVLGGPCLNECHGCGRGGRRAIELIEACRSGRRRYGPHAHHRVVHRGRGSSCSWCAAEISESVPWR
jgi:hypothetical protein